MVPPPISIHPPFPDLLTPRTPIGTGTTLWVTREGPGPLWIVPHGVPTPVPSGFAIHLAVLAASFAIISRPNNPLAYPTRYSEEGYDRGRLRTPSPYPRSNSLKIGSWGVMANITYRGRFRVVMIGVVDVNTPTEVGTNQHGHEDVGPGGRCGVRPVHNLCGHSLRTVYEQSNREGRENP